MKKKKICFGILAHVDSGKTTLSEAILFNSGKIRKLGRVDHKDSFLDNNSIERERGITIYSKQAVFETEHTIFTLLDTPGHADFGAETERCLGVLDYAILVISATEGVQSHTRTLWKLLEKYSVPCFIFVNKTDISFKSKDEITDEIKSKLSENCHSFSDSFDDAFFEEISMCDEDILNEFLEGKVTDDSIKNAIKKRHIFPCFFGSALKNDGVFEFTDFFDKFTFSEPQKEDFGAKVFKISEDDRGNRLTHIKITSGSLLVKTELEGITEGNAWQEKVNEIRIYSADKYESVLEASQGTVCAVTGLVSTYPGQGLGCEKDTISLTLEPVFSYTVIKPDDVPDSDALEAFKKLSQEETKLNVSWNSTLKQISVQLMGEVQTEVLTKVIKDRFGFEVSFDRGAIIYKETIRNTVEGVGHYEPLRHYAEVHLILKPGKKGSGVTFDTSLRDDVLDTNWQRLILSHLAEKTHLGVLTGSPITDINITLAGGKAHLKHTEGGDFRQATYRAVRHGLMNAQSVLLEPWYDFKIEVPNANVGRVMTDISRMGGSFSSPETDGEMSYISGSAPVKEIQFYQKEIISFSKGLGSIAYSFKGYEPCKNQDEIVQEFGYNPESDLDNSPDSVFCAHGAAVFVKWNEVYDRMDLESVFKKSKEAPLESLSPGKSFDGAGVSDNELNRIFEMTFGKPKEKEQKVVNRTGHINVPVYKSKGKPESDKEEYILVDGYNIIFAWEDMKALADKNIDLARNTLITRLVNYQAVKKCQLAVVFDAYKVKGSIREIEKHNGISVVYTKEAETADSYIEKTSHTLASKYRVRVATSDNLEQMIILGAGALRIPALTFQKEVEDVEDAIKTFIKKE